MVTLPKGAKLAIMFVGIGVAVGVGITFALFQQRDLRQAEVIYDSDKPFPDPSFLQSYKENLRTGAHYKSSLAIGEEGFFYADAKGGREPYRFEWKFSDGVILTSQNSTRSFDLAGEYSAQLTVIDAGGQQKISNISVRVVE